ncbi:MAG: ribosome silencing factor [Candidatus Cloacimonadota bacterium]|nr:ribosome silencing factor [Candidatus Cloacimonadota bacterium]
MKNDDKLIKNTLNKAIDSINDKKGENIISLKFSSEISSICDYFLICEATNIKQAQAISDNIQRTLRTDIQIRPSHVEGYDTANWILLDYFDIIIHIFLHNTRDFYGLEKLWADAEMITY